MEDFDQRRPHTSEALIAVLEAANLPPLPDDWRRMIVELAPLETDHRRAARGVRKS
jgi:hypothetical protein